MARGSLETTMSTTVPDRFGYYSSEARYRLV